MKSQKKNKTNQVVTWPTSTLFSLEELHHLNAKFVEITLRVRLTKAIESGKVVEIGCIPGEKGRPKKVYSFTPVTRLTIEKAKSEKINMVDNVERLIQVVSVSNRPANPQVNPAVPIPTPVNS